MIKRFLKIWSKQSERGALLVEVAIASFVVIATAVFFGWVTEQTRFNFKLAKSAKLFGDIEPALKSYIWQRLRSYAGDGCPSNVFPMYINTNPIGTYGTAQYFRTGLNSGTDANPTLADASATNIPAFRKEALTRCASPIIMDDQQSDLRFCFQVHSALNKSEVHSNESLFEMSGVFVEVRAQMIDLPSNKPEKCINWQSVARVSDFPSHTVGIRAAYGIHWGYQDQGRTVYRVKYGYIYGAQ